jgi:hypothetical protein
MVTVLRYLWRILTAAVVLTGIIFLTYNLLGRLQDIAAAVQDQRLRLGITFASALCVSIVLSYLVLRSRWSGTQLMCAVFVAYFGLFTFIPQSEAVLVMAGRLTLSSSALLTAQGFLGALLYSVVLVALMGRLRDGGEGPESARLHMGAGEWLWKVGLCVVIGPAVGLLARAAFWPWTQPLPDRPLLHSASLLAGCSLLLIAFMLPIIKMMRGDRLEAALMVGVLLAVLGGAAPLVTAQVWLPDKFSVGHMVGISVATLLYGMLVGFLFSREARMH